MALQENSWQLCESSDVACNFNINLNKTFDLNKREEHLEASGGIKPTLEPFSKLIFDCKNQKKVPRKSSEIESDESLGILPDVLNEEMTFDLLKTELSFSDNDIYEFDSEINENPSSSVFSPPSDNQFNKISLFLKNVSTPLANFEKDRRFSSTPKILVAGQFLANTTNVIEHNSSSYFLDEKEDPIIAGSCCIKFETDFNLDDLKNVKPLTSTCKTLSLPQAPLVLNNLNEQTNLKSKVNCQEKPETVLNNLSITQTFSNNTESVTPRKHEDSTQNVDTLNNTFKVKLPDFEETVDAVVSFSKERLKNCNEKERVKLLDCTFAIAENEISDNVESQNTFVIDSKLTTEMEKSPNPNYKENILNETHVLEIDPFEQIANVTFIKNLDDTDINFGNHYNFQSTAFEPMSQILEETFSENDLNVTKVHVKNSVQCSGQGQRRSENFNTKTTFSENPEHFSKKIIKNDDQFEFVSSNSPTVLSNKLLEEAEKKPCCHEQINLVVNENLSIKMSLSDSLKSIRDSFSEKVCKRTDLEVDKFHKSFIKRDDSLTEIVSSEKLANTTFDEEMREKKYSSNQIHFTENENIPTNKMLSNPLQQISSSMFSRKTNEVSVQEMNKIFRRYSMPNENTGELESIRYSVERKYFTSNGSEESNLLESSVFQDSHSLDEKSTKKSQPILGRTAYSLDSDLFHNHHAENKFSESNKDSFFNISTSASEEIEIFTHSSLIENSLPTVSSTNTFSENTDQLQSFTNSISTDNDQVQLPQNSLKDFLKCTFSEKTDKVHIEPHSIPTDIDKSQQSPNEIKNIPFSNSPNKDIKIQHEICLNQPKNDSAGEAQSNFTKKLCLKDTLPKKVADNQNSFPKSCSLESKNAVKSRFSKPTRIVFPRVVSDQHAGQLPLAKSLCKPNNYKKPIASDFNRTFNNSADKTFAKDVSRKFSLPSLNIDKSKCKNNFKKPFEIPSKLVTKKPMSNYQNSNLNTSYSTGHLKNIALKNGNLNSPPPDLISDINSKVSKSSASVYGKRPKVSSRLSLYEKLPIKSSKTKECGLKANTVSVNNLEKKAKITSAPKVIDLPRKEKMTGSDNANLGKHSSRHSVSRNSPRKFANSLINIPNKVYDSKSVVFKQKSAPAGNSSECQYMKTTDNEKLPKSIPKPKLSLLPTKVSYKRSESTSPVDKALSSGNQKCNSFLPKPCIPKSETVQVVKTQISTRQKLKANVRENALLDSSIGPTSNVNKSIVRDNFLPKPKVIKDAKSTNLIGICTAPKSELQNRVCQQTSRKLPQLRRIPSPHYHK